MFKTSWLCYEFWLLYKAPINPCKHLQCMSDSKKKNPICKWIFFAIWSFSMIEKMASEVPKLEWKFLENRIKRQPGICINYQILQKGTKIDFFFCQFRRNWCLKEVDLLQENRENQGTTWESRARGQLDLPDILTTINQQDSYAFPGVVWSLLGQCISLIKIVVRCTFHLSIPSLQ